MHGYCKECAKRKSKKWQKDNYDRYQKVFNNRAKRRRSIPENMEYHRIKAREQTANGYQKEYQKNNKDKMRKYRIDRNANKKHEITKNEWLFCKEYFNNSCAYCGLKQDEHYVMWKGELKKMELHKEHVNHNGSNGIDNCVPACRDCNSSKWKYELNEWYTYNNKIFNKHRFSRIVKWLDGDYLKLNNTK